MYDGTHRRDSRARFGLLGARFRQVSGARVLPMHGFSRRLTVAIALVVLFLTLGACGNNDNNPYPGDATTTEPVGS